MSKVLKDILAFLAFLFLINCTTITAAEHGDKVEKFDAGKFIFGHISDSYDFHITSFKHIQVSVPLLVILKSEERGWFVFSSNKVTHGNHYRGFYIQKGGAFDAKIVEVNSRGEIVRPIDLSITKDAFSIFLSIAILLIIFIPTAVAYKKNPLKVPKKRHLAVESLIRMMEDDVIKPSIGNDYRKYSPYLLTAFFFILVCNLMGLIPIFPFGANVTGNLSITLVLALFTYFITNLFANREYWKEIFWPDVPLWLKFPIPIMPFIEIISTITKPFALMVRLFANIFAGHMIMLVFMSLIFIFGAISPAIGGGISVISISFAIFMSFLELLVAFIQAYVFTTLSAVFIGLSRVQAHEHEKE